MLFRLSSNEGKTSGKCIYSVRRIWKTMTGAFEHWDQFIFCFVSLLVACSSGWFIKFNKQKYHTVKMRIAAEATAIRMTATKEISFFLELFCFAFACLSSEFASSVFLWLMKRSSEIMSIFSPWSCTNFSASVTILWISVIFACAVFKYSPLSRSSFLYI